MKVVDIHEDQQILNAYKAAEVTQSIKSRRSKKSKYEDPEEESEYESEYESEEDEDEEQSIMQAPPTRVGGWTDQGSIIQDPVIKRQTVSGEAKNEKPKKATPKHPVSPKVKKEFDPRHDKMFEIDSNENYLMESLKNFKPPEEHSLDQSYISALEQMVSDNKGGQGSLNQRDAQAVGGVKLNMMFDNERDY